MTNLENKLFDGKPQLKPTIYARYLDNCFLVIDAEKFLLQLKEAFQLNSVKCTYELRTIQRLTFLDVYVDGLGEQCTTSVYTKPTDIVIYMNEIRECPWRYKDSTVKALIHRT